ncbi:MAG: carboxypeptidase-like regulatory domain-containing protein [Bryobacteraceae bacterium]
MHQEYTTAGDNRGVFHLDGLLAGPYTLEITVPGFQKRVLRHVRVKEGVSNNLGSIKMQLAPCGTQGVICDNVSPSKR